MTAKKGLGFWFGGITLVLSLVALVFVFLNFNSEYYQDMNALVLVALVAAIALQALVMFVKVPKLCKDLAIVTIAVLLIYATISFLGMRIQSFGFIFASNLELGNDAAFSAGTQAIYTVIIGVVAWLTSVVGSFLNLTKEN